MDYLKIIVETISLLSIILGVSNSIKSIWSFFAGIAYTLFDKNLAIIFIVVLYLRYALDLLVFLTTTYNYEESFRAIEHMALVTVAVAAATVGRFIARNSSDDSVKFRFRSVFYSIATGLLVYAFFI
jgi:hypothetical protein